MNRDLLENQSRDTLYKWYESSGTLVTHFPDTSLCEHAAIGLRTMHVDTFEQTGPNVIRIWGDFARRMYENLKGAGVEVSGEISPPSDSPSQN